MEWNTIEYISQPKGIGVKSRFLLVDLYIHSSFHANYVYRTDSKMSEWISNPNEPLVTYILMKLGVSIPLQEVCLL